MRSWKEDNRRKDGGFPLPELAFIPGQANVIG